MLKTPSTVFSACKNGPVLCNGLLYHSKIIIVNAPFYWNQLTIKTLFGRISKFFNKFQGCFTQSGTLEQYSRPSCGTSLQQHLQNFNFQLKYSFRKKDCGYSSWWITIKVKFFRLSHDVVTCDVDRDVSTAYCWSSSGDEVDWSCVTL